MDDDYLETCVTIDEVAIQEEFMRLPSDYAFWASKYTDARRTHRMSKLNCDSVRGRLSISLRLDLEQEKSRVTEGMIMSAIDTHDDMFNARKTEIEDEAELTRMSGILEALKTKREMLISLGAHARAEMKTI